MFSPKFNTKKISEEVHILNLVHHCKKLLPTKTKTTYHETDFLGDNELTIDNRFKLHIRNFKQKNNKPFKTLKVSFYIPKEKKYKEVLIIDEIANHRDYRLEEFWNGYSSSEVVVKEKSISGDRFGITLYSAGVYDIFLVYDQSGELLNIGYMKNGYIKSFYEFTKGNKVFSYTPITNKTEVTVSLGFWTLATSLVIGFFGMWFYFGSVWLALGISIFSACLLLLNDKLNPNNHPVINILQAIIYALVIIFVK